MSSTLRLPLLAFAVTAAGSLAAGCASSTAIVDGQTVPRLTQMWAGQPYLVEHTRAHPRPRGPSSGLRDDGGSIGGRVCGMDVVYGVEHEGDHVQLIGFVDQRYPSQIQVHDTHGERHITGNISGHSVDLKLKSDELSGHVGLRVLYVVQEGDELVGHMRIGGAVNARDPVNVPRGRPQVLGYGADAPIAITLSGRDALWSMPAAAQAAILSNLLMCELKSSNRGPAQGWTAGFGGVPTANPYNTSTLYSAGR